MSRFPKDCWNKKCPYFEVIDLSIDDLCCTCTKLNIECDACDENYSFLKCPLEDNID